MSEPMCDVRVARRHQGNMCGGAAPALSRREADNFGWTYDWQGGDLVRVRFDGIAFDLERRIGGVTENNVDVMIRHFRRTLQNERERDIRGNGALRWLADLWSGEPPNRSEHFAQMERAAERATAAAARRDLGAVLRELQRGLVYLATARQLYASYFARHIRGAERNVQIVELTRDVSLTVAPAVLTGGASLGTQVAVGVAVSGGTTLIEEVGVSGFGRHADIDWGRIAIDSTIGLVASLTGPLLGDLSTAATKRLGRMARSAGMTRALIEAVEQRFPRIAPELREAILRDSLDVPLRSLGADAETLKTIIGSVLVDAMASAPEQLVQRLVETTLRNLMNQGRSGRIDVDQFCSEFVESLAKDNLCRGIVTSIVAALAT